MHHGQRKTRPLSPSSAAGTFETSTDVRYTAGCGGNADMGTSVCRVTGRVVPPRGDRLLGGGDAGEIGAVRSGIVMLRARLAGEEQAIVHRRGQRAPAVRSAG